MREFLVALNASFTSTIEKGLALALEVTDARLEVTSFMFQIDLRANAQKYRAKGDHGQNLTLLCFELIERY